MRISNVISMGIDLSLESKTKSLSKNLMNEMVIYCFIDLMEFSYDDIHYNPLIEGQLNFKGVINYITIDCHNTSKEYSPAAK